MRTWSVVLITVATLVLAASCGKKAGGSGKPKVAVSIFPIYDVTKRIAGDRLEVLLVLPPGKSEHGYDPTPKEIARLEGAKLGIAVGLDMDGWVENIMKTAGGAGKIVRIGDKVKTIPIDVEPIEDGEEHHDEHAGEKHEGSGEKHDDHDKPTAGSGSATKHDEHEGEQHDDHDKKPAAGSGTAEKQDEHEGEKHEDDDHEAEEHHDHKLGAPDPHVWLDPDRMITIIDAITAELSAIDPAGKAAFEANATALKDSIKKTDAAIQERAKAWTKHTIVTFHGSMAYFAKRYGLRIAAVVEPIAGKEPTATYIAEVIGAIKRSKAAALFTEPQLDRGPGETIAREAGIPLGELDPVGGVKGRDSYESLLVWNTDQLEKALK